MKYINHKTVINHTSIIKQTELGYKQTCLPFMKQRNHKKAYVTVMKTLTLDDMILALDTLCPPHPHILLYCALIPRRLTFHLQKHSPSPSHLYLPAKFASGKHHQEIRRLEGSEEGYLFLHASQSQKSQRSSQAAFPIQPPSLGFSHDPILSTLQAQG